ncbi:uncharacterized protein EV154DRAFT_483978 [Mucor mucedo]|uniref:uncharacterized protein n=1 Tax=Mucor mucedo TaxID=29922 RepID=UPI002220D387|nr:uncharacterized protein EV154DRAFT_483978 [Mucor mucedo]KAI7888637.1 hypothetical protein EV154DRAFT_483978 [Mucor mucedo]
MISREIISEMTCMLKKIDRSWNRIFANCSKGISKIIKDNHDAYLASYIFMDEMTGTCNDTVVLLKTMIEEKNKTLPDKKLDINSIENFTDCMKTLLTNLILKEVTVVNVDGSFPVAQSNSIEDAYPARKSRYPDEYCHKSSSTHVKENTDRKAILSVNCKMSLEAISSSFLFGFILNLCTFVDYNVTKYYISFYKKRNLINLSDALGNMMDIINKLHSTHNKFYQQTERATKKIKKSIALCEKMSRQSSKRHNTKKSYHVRVQSMATDMTQDIQEYISIFERLHIQISKSRHTLKEHILMNNPRAFIKHNK